VIKGNKGMPDLIEKYSVPRVGLGVLVLRDGKCLLSKRWEKDGTFVWCMPGGHLEHGESLEGGGRRETREEAGIEIENVRIIVAGNQLEFLPKHYVWFGLVADWKEGEPRNEESKMTDWTWFPLTKLPEPIYQPSKRLVEFHLGGKLLILDEGSV
jgi:8-oxo-dGTP diphosphatase